VYTEKPIYFYDINREWMFEFKKFNETKRENTLEKTYKTFGGVIGSTIKKKVGIFISFMKWASEKKYCSFPNDIMGFSKEIGLTDVVKSTITQKELISLTNLEIENKYKQFVRDLFVFSCMTGLRWSDLMSLNKKHIKKYDQGIAIVKKSEKTKNNFNVFLNDVSLAILERYNYNLNRMTNPAYNRELKKFLKSTGLFNDSTDFKKEGRTLQRWETISIHRGRDSFITILLSLNVPPNHIMQYTGHKQLRTLEGYVDKNTKVPNFTNKIIEIN
jgi:integrase